MESILFKFEIGDTPFVKDTLTRASESVFRVEVTGLDDTAGVPRYWVRPYRCCDVSSWLIDESALTIIPVAKGLSPAHRTRWKHMRSKANTATRKIDDEYLH